MHKGPRWWYLGRIKLVNASTGLVSVDRYYAQDRISIESDRRFPRQREHIIAEVTSDVCNRFNHRVITASITYRDGTAAILLRGDTVRFTARRTGGLAYSGYLVELFEGANLVRAYSLRFESRYFDSVNFEIDRTANSARAMTTYNTSSHPNRPANLPAERISIKSVWQRAGFDVEMSPQGSVIPNAGSGANGTWSDAEMHNAMISYWSHFADRPQWAMWVHYARRHDLGRGLGGIMFDDIGPNHRQGTDMFTNSFTNDVPVGTAKPKAWRNRMHFWTVVHEMGHGFNLAHAW